MSFSNTVQNRMTELSNQEYHDQESMKCSFNFTKTLVNKIDFLAKKMRTTRQEVVTLALSSAIDEGLAGYAETKGLSSDEFIAMTAQAAAGDAESKEERS